MRDKMDATRSVMIIDEDPSFRAELAAMVKPANWEAVAASGYGVEAASLAEEKRPQLVLTAVQAPESRAIRTIRSIRAVLPDTPVIAYSEITEMAVVRQLLQAGVRDFLPLPLHDDDLLDAIDRAMAEVSNTADVPAREGAAAGVVLTVFGAKGGIGKSTIATNLATAITGRTDHSVLIIDLDTRFGDIAIMMDIDAPVTLADLASNIDTLDRQTFRNALTEHESGVYVLSAPKHPREWRSMSPDQLRLVVQMAARLFDYVILDTPGALNDVVSMAVEEATQLILVTSLDMFSIKDSAYVLDLLQSEGYPDRRLLLVVNNVNQNHTLSAEDVERVLLRNVDWQIPYDARVVRTSQIGLPVVVAKPKSPSSRSLVALAGHLTGNVSMIEEARKTGFLRWLPRRLGFGGAAAE